MFLMNRLLPALADRAVASPERIVDRLFDEMWNEAFADWPLTATAPAWPALDVSETADAYMVKVEVPGLEAKDLKVEFLDDTLTISGEKKSEIDEKAEGVHLHERYGGAFSRSIRLPAPVDAEKVNASLKNGVLTLELPKTEGAKPRQIPIRAEPEQAPPQIAGGASSEESGASSGGSSK